MIKMFVYDNYDIKDIADDWGRPGGRIPRESCLAISAHHLKEERKLHHHDEAASRWCSKQNKTEKFFLQRLRISSAGSNSPPRLSRT